MKKFIAKVALLSFIALIIALFVDYAISEGLKKTEEYRFQRWNNEIDAEMNANVLIMGNSRAAGHYSPTILDSILGINSYNLGLGGYSFPTQYLRFKYYEQYGSKPDLIIQNIDFGTLTKTPFGHEKEQIFPYINNKVLRNNVTEFGVSNIDIYLPLIRYFGYSMVIKNGLLEFLKLKHYNRQPAIKGHRPEQGAWNGTELRKLMSIEAKMKKESIELFEHFLSYCNSNNIKVILVNTPTYIEATQKLCNEKEFKFLINSIANKYSIPFLDYTYDSISNDSTLFKEAVHLNPKGTELFSTKLAHDMKNLNLY